MSGGEAAGPVLGERVGKRAVVAGIALWMAMWGSFAGAVLVGPNPLRNGLMLLGVAAAVHFVAAVGVVVACIRADLEG